MASNQYFFCHFYKNKKLSFIHSINSEYKIDIAKCTNKSFMIEDALYHSLIPFSNQKKGQR